MKAQLPASAAADPPIGRDGSYAANRLLFFSCIYRRWRWGSPAGLAFPLTLA
jgi:hypothetical protein